MLPCPTAHCALDTSPSASAATVPPPPQPEPTPVFYLPPAGPALLYSYSTAPNREGGRCAYNNNGLWQLAGRDQIQGAQTAVAAVAQIHTLARSIYTHELIIHACPWILAWPGLSASTFVRVCVRALQSKLKIAQQPQALHHSNTALLSVY